MRKRWPKEWQGMNWLRKSLRLAILDRDGWACVYCRSVDNLQIDHLKPRAKGGHNGPANLVTACQSCNASKGDSRWTQFAGDDDVIARINRLRRRSVKTRRARAKKALQHMSWSEALAYFTPREACEPIRHERDDSTDDCWLDHA